MNKRKTLEELDRQELLTMLRILLDSAEAENDSDTVLKRININSFQWVINRAIEKIRST